MPTYMLEGQATVRLTPKPVTIALQMAGPVPGRLVALVDGQPLATAVRPRPDLLILPQVADAVTLRVEPTGASVFAQGSRANVSVSANDPGAVDPERAVLPPVDLAGLSGQNVLSIRPGDDGLRVRSEVREVVRVQLGPLADAARVAATELIGRQRLEESEAIDVNIAVDASASFRRQVASGQLRRIVDVIEGISSVIDPDRRSAAHLLAAASAERAAVSADERTSLAAALGRAIADATPETGAGLASGANAPLRSIVGGEGRSLTYVITDAAPADRAAFEALGEPGRHVAHLVVIGRGSAWRLQRAPETPVTLLDLERVGPAPADAVSPDPLATAAAPLRALVAELLDGRPS